MLKFLKRTFSILLILLLTLLIIWCGGRYGWKLRGFDATESATIESIEVTETSVHIEGKYSGFVPKGFVGYIYKEENNILYVGYHYSSIFGFFDLPSFEIDIPIQNDIEKVYTKTNNKEYLIWERE